MRFYENQIPFADSINDLGLFLHQQGLFINKSYYPGDEVTVNVPNGGTVTIDGVEYNKTTKIFRIKGETYTVQYPGYSPIVTTANNNKVKINPDAPALKFTANS